MTVEVLATAPGRSGEEPLLVKAGGLFFTSSIQADDETLPPIKQFDRCYGRINALLSGNASVQRLDHFVKSQSSLGDRQKVRAAHFGLPAPLASTGVRTMMLRESFLNVAAIACSADLAPSVLVDGESFGMPFISSAVRAGELIFVSGILVRDGESPVEECFAQIRHILTLCGVTEEHILRQDVYARSDSLMTLVREHLVGVPNVSLINEFDGDSVLEVTTVASVAKPTVVGASRRTSEMLFTDSCISDSGTVDDAIAGALENVVATVQSAGFSASDMVRVDAVVGDPRFGALVSEEVARRLPTASPVVVWRAGSTTRRALVDLAAIAHR